MMRCANMVYRALANLIADIIRRAGLLLPVIGETYTSRALIS